MLGYLLTSYGREFWNFGLVSPFKRWFYVVVVVVDAFFSSIKVAFYLIWSLLFYYFNVFVWLCCAFSFGIRELFEKYFLSWFSSNGRVSWPAWQRISFLTPLIWAPVVCVSFSALHWYFNFFEWILKRKNQIIFNFEINFLKYCFCVLVDFRNISFLIN